MATPAPYEWETKRHRAVPRGPEPRQDRAVRTRSLVLRTAAELFAAKGFRETSINEVAERMQMTKGAVYHHFPSKEILAISVVEVHYERWPALLTEVRAEGLSPMDTAITLLNRVTEAFCNDPIVQAGARLQLERSLIDAPLPTPYVGWTDILSDLFHAAQEAGQLREGIAPQQAARTVIAAFFGTQHISDTLHQRADLLERWHETRDLLFLAIRA